MKIICDCGEEVIFNEHKDYIDEFMDKDSVHVTAEGYIKYYPVIVYDIIYNYIICEKCNKNICLKL